MNKIDTRSFVAGAASMFVGLAVIGIRRQKKEQLERRWMEWVERNNQWRATAN